MTAETCEEAGNAKKWQGLVSGAGRYSHGVRDCSLREFRPFLDLHNVLMLLVSSDQPEKGYDVSSRERDRTDLVVIVQIQHSPGANILDAACLPMLPLTCPKPDVRCSCNAD